MPLSDSFFGQKFGITEHDLESYLSEALAAGGDYADLYFEYLATSQLSIDESIVKSAVQGVSLGVGVRVIAGERTGYAYSDDLSPEKIRKAARVAACIANGPSKVEKTGFEGRRAPARSLSRCHRAERNQPGRARGTGEAGGPSGACGGPARVSGAGQLRRQLAPRAGGHQRRRSEHRSPAAGSPGRVGAGA